MRRVKAQSTSEYSICVVVIILAVVAMQMYVKRGLQGRYADVVDFTTTQAKAYHQYEPYYQKEDLGSTQDAYIETHVGKDGPGTINKVINDSLTRNGEIRDLINYSDDK